MHNELNIRIGSKNYKAFLQNGFYSSAVQTVTMHKHNYAEVHITDGHGAVFNVAESTHSSSEGNVIIIPQNTYHCIKSCSENTRHVAFQVDFDVKSFAWRSADFGIVSDFINEIEKTRVTNDYVTVSSYISLFCSYFSSETIEACPIDDYGFLIREFFSRHYHEDIRLSDLADVLHLSERQTERLVIKSTGNTFLRELSLIRINAAEHLERTADMSMEEISRYVGYRSYAGFWKAKKRYTGN
jgi:AraC-like DNA-binding protein